MPIRILLILFLFLCKNSFTADTTYVNQLNEMAWGSMSRNLDSVQYYCSKADSISHKIGYAKGTAYSKIYQGWVHFYLGENDQAQLKYNEAIKIGLLIKNKNVEGRAKLSLGAYFTKIGDLVQGMTYYQDALPLLKETNDIEWENYAYNNIGVNFESQNQLKQARTYYTKAIASFQKRNDSIGIALSYNNISNCFYGENNLDSAILYSISAKQLSKKIGFNILYGASSARLAEYYLEQNDYPQTILHLNDAEKTYTEIDSKEGILEVKLFTSQLYLKQQKYDAALNVLKAIEKQVNNSTPLVTHASFHSKFTAAYEGIGDYYNAVKHLKQYVKWNDSLINITSREQINEMEVKYQTNEKQLEIANLNQEKRLMLLQNEQQKIEEERQKKIKNYGFLFGGVVALLLSIIVIVITRKNKRINLYNKEIAHQKDLVDEKNAEIMDSINYAQHIQKGFLPQKKAIKQGFSNSFLFFQPKDIVSGDFYWYVDTSKAHYMAIADCTGHGVPGAMISAICHNALDTALKNLQKNDPGQILDESKLLLAHTFSNSENTVINDGMDISLIRLDKETSSLKWAGANNPLWQITASGELIVHKANKQAVDRHPNSQSFITHTISYQKEDCFYLFSDGFADQFGGEKGKKFKTANFKKLLLTIHSQPMEEQQEAIVETLKKWQGNQQQVDDISIFGFRI